MNSTIFEYNDFNLIERISETSQTITWKAFQISLNRMVFLRVLTPEMALQPTEVARFVTIARHIANVKSDALVTIFDIVSEGDLHYIVMEYFDGPTLEELVDSCGTLPIEQVLKIMAFLATGIELLWNSSQLVHRNLKSSIIRLGPLGTPKIMDFSLAIVVNPNVEATAMDHGHIVGTPCFISPEQAQGSPILTTQSDMYALGAIGYHLSTGNVPFEGQDAVTALAGHIQHRIPPPHHLNTKVPITFSWFIHHLMMKNPANRYSNWRDVLEDIHHQLNKTYPNCARTEDLFLSTIDSMFAAPFDSTQPPQFVSTDSRIQISHKSKTPLITASQDMYQLQKTSAITPQTRSCKYQLLWAFLVSWFIIFFWFRAVSSQSVTEFFLHFKKVLLHRALSLDTILPKPSTQINTLQTSTILSSTKISQSTLTIPLDLSKQLAVILAKGNLVTAQTLVKAFPSPFKNQTAILRLLADIPEPDTLVLLYLKNRVNQSLILERNGKHISIIPRGLKNNMPLIEINGRIVQFPVSQLNPDEKLRWMEPPKNAAQYAAYCLMLMHSIRRDEVADYAQNCPLLTSVLLEATTLAMTASETSLATHPCAELPPMP